MEQVLVSVDSLGKTEDIGRRVSRHGLRSRMRAFSGDECLKLMSEGPLRICYAVRWTMLLAGLPRGMHDRCRQGIIHTFILAFGFIFANNVSRL